MAHEDEAAGEVTFPARFLDEIKNIGTPQCTYKLRLLACAWNDKMLYVEAQKYSTISHLVNGYYTSVPSNIR